MRTRRLAARVWVGVWVAAAGSAAWSPASRGAEPAAVVSAARALVVEPGEWAAMPIERLGVGGASSVGSPAPGAVEVVFEGGGRSRGEVVRLVGRLDASRSASEPGRWLPPAPVWSAGRGDEPTPAPPEARRARLGRSGPVLLTERLFVLFEAPEPGPTWVSVGGRRASLVWPEGAGERVRQGRAPRPEASVEARRRLGDRLRAAASDPLERWRVRLVAERFGEQALFGAGGTPGIGAGRLGRVAESVGLQRRAALAALDRLDAELAAAVLARLTAVVRTPGGELVPAWPAGDPRADELLGLLIDPARSDRAKVGDARAFVASFAPVLAWVESEAPAADGSAVRVRVGAANMTLETETATLAPAGGTARDIRPLGPHEAGVLGFTLERDADASAPGSGRGTDVVEVRLGERSVRLRVVTAWVSAIPPGAPLGPLHGWHTMGSWLSGSAPPAGGWGTSVRLTRRAVDPVESGRREGWVVRVEASRPVGGAGGAGGAGGRDVVRVWLGGAGSPRSVLVMGPGEGVGVEGWGGRAVRGGVRERSDGSGWTGWVEVPAGVLPARGPAAVGVTREVGGGVLAWPRPLLPGEREPGGLGVELGRWWPGAVRGD